MNIDFLLLLCVLFMYSGLVVLACVSFILIVIAVRLLRMTPKVVYIYLQIKIS